MVHNSKKAWTTLENQTDDPPSATYPGMISANQVAHQLLLKDKASNKLPKYETTYKTH